MEGRSKMREGYFFGYRIKLKGQDFVASGIRLNSSFAFLPFYLSKIITSLFFQADHEYSCLQQNGSLTELLKC